MKFIAKQSCWNVLYSRNSVAPWQTGPILAIVRSPFSHNINGMAEAGGVSYDPRGTLVIIATRLCCAAHLPWYHGSHNKSPCIGSMVHW